MYNYEACQPLLKGEKTLNYDVYIMADIIFVIQEKATDHEQHWLLYLPNRLNMKDKYPIDMGKMSFFYNYCWERVKFAITKNWTPMQAIDLTKAVTQHFLEKSF